MSKYTYDEDEAMFVDPDGYELLVGDIVELLNRRFNLSIEGQSFWVGLVLGSIGTAFFLISSLWPRLV